jgi:hypothetical protein
MNAVPMICACMEHQHPEEFGRPEVPYLHYTELGSCGLRSPEPYAGEYTLPGVTTWCVACDCDHGDPPRIVLP